MFPDAVPPNETALGLGPVAALKNLCLETMTNDERVAWLESSRIDAVLGSCRLSVKFVRSGYRCYVGFARKAEPTRTRVLPPKLFVLQAWSTTFRSEGTFSNYLGHVKTACLICGVSVKVNRSFMLGVARLG